MDVQLLVIGGRAVRDAELLETKGKKPANFVAFSIAVNRYMGKEQGQDTSFYDCLAFGQKNVERASDRIKRGDFVIAVGRPELDAYINKDGEATPVQKMIVEQWWTAKPSSKSAGKKKEAAAERIEEAD